MIGIYFLIALGASLIGAISGIGGGVIIKPVMDSLGTMDVATVSFLSGCTVLTMSALSVFRNQNSTVVIEKSITIWLAIGASFGGIAGKWAFNLIKNAAENPNQVGIIQAITLLLINIGVFVYMRYKEKVHTRQVTHPFFCHSIGLGLGIISSFLGIGGGPINIAVLYFFFSMKPKQTTINSLFVILCSQLTSLFSTLLTRTVPEFSWPVLFVMCCGGAGGAFIGSMISKKTNDHMVQRLFTIVLVLLIGINLYNIMQFALL